jgi:amyloid beta precursor protein binding protein 1
VNCELHTVSAVIGGIAAQETFKLIAHRYTPLNNVLVFNGTYAVIARMKL